MLLGWQRPSVAITEQHLRFLLIYEPATLVVFSGFLILRGWTIQRLGLCPRFTDFLIGVGLAVGAYIAQAVLWILMAAANLQPAYLYGASSLVAGNFSLATVIAVSIVNPLFEELFVCGYIITFTTLLRSFAIFMFS